MRVALAILVLVIMVPAADAATFTQTSDGVPVAFRPCRALAWRLNLNGAPEAQRANVRAAFNLVASATGFRFVQWDDTTVIPQRKRNAAAEADADIVVAFATKRETTLGLGSHDGYDTLGVGGFSAVIGRFALGASVVIDRTDVADHTDVELRRVYMHELAHALGLAHVTPAGNVLTAIAEDGPAAWGPDDLRGLTAVGRVAGCLPRKGKPPLVTAPQLPLALAPAPAGVRLDGDAFVWDPDVTQQTAFYTVRLARTTLGADGWGEWQYQKRERVLLPGSERVTLPTGWETSETQAVAIVVRAFNQLGYNETTLRSR